MRPRAEPGTVAGTCTFTSGKVYAECCREVGNGSFSDAPGPELSEIEAQVIEVKRLLAELEKNIQDQLKRGQ